MNPPSLPQVQRRLMAEWNKLESAADGTLRHRGYRMAQAVLSREDPDETFFKQVPIDPGSELEISYPAALKERLVRRRLRHLAANGHRLHRCRLAAWGLAMVPQLPLMLTPLPNLTVYYTGYRIYSHYKALQGCKALERAFLELDSAQLRALSEDLLRHQRERMAGAPYPPEGWPARLLRREWRYLDIFDRLRGLRKQWRLQQQLKADGQASAAEGETTAAEETIHWDGEEQRQLQQDQQQQSLEVDFVKKRLQQLEKQQQLGTLLYTDEHESEERHVVGLGLEFLPSVELSSLIQVGARQRTPLGDEAAVAVARAFKQPQLLSLVARSRKKARGAMFLTDMEEGG
jgi:hypothetical protein